jgi:multicomponent Na+:H+ antiporter subunit C
MVGVWAAVVGVLYAAGLYMMLRRSGVRLLIGLTMLAHGANLLIFVAGGPKSRIAPLVPEGAVAPPEDAADPLPQALILTAIVIGFAVLAFALALFHRVYRRVGTLDLDELGEADR